MQNYVLSCCSTVDLSAAHLSRRQVPYVCFHYVIDGESYPDDLGQSVSFKEFYDKMREGAAPTTAQVNVQQFTEFWEPFLKEGKDVLHVSLSSGISGAFSAANTTREQLLARYPERRIEVVDSLAASSGYGLLIDMLCDKRDAGASLDELRAYAEDLKRHVHHWFFTSDLTALIRGGRVSKTAGFFGSLLGVCPLMHVNPLGKLVPVEKVRTKKKVKQVVVERMKQYAKDGVNYSGKCYISHSDCLEDAQDVARAIEEAFPQLDGKVLINYVGTVIGSHTGYDLVALFFIGEERKEQAAE